MVVDEGQLRGTFRGFRNRDTEFLYRNGDRWKQAAYKYRYRYMYMPKARVVRRGSRYDLEIEGMDESVEVRRA